MVPQQFQQTTISTPISRPISLTSCLCKVLEDFVVSWMITDMEDRIDPRQFGCLIGTSTTYCLLDMIHGRHLRICFLDLAKAFDCIGHNMVISKLLDLGVRRSLVPWIINFLFNRRHRAVKLGDIISDLLPMKAGVPQGTKLGQGTILFLVMINNLNPRSSGTDIWKFVDDVSTSEGMAKNSNSNMQSNLDSICSWSLQNYMKLNVKKCKELRICFLKDKPELSPLLTDEQALEIVQSH